MALSGSFTGSAICGGHYNLKVTWTASQDIGNNTSTVTAKLYLVSDWALEIGARTHTITIDGASFSITSGSLTVDNGYQETLLGEVTKTIQHSADGSRSFDISANIDFRAWIDQYYSNISGSDSFTLDTIPRASQPSCITYPQTTENVGDIGTEIIIHMNRASDSFLHTVKYQFGSESGTIANNVTDYCYWTLPMTLCNQIPNSASGVGSIIVDTYKDGVCIGIKSVSFICSVPSSVVPSITNIAVSDATGLKDTYEAYIQNKSKATVNVTASGAYNSTITSYKITANDSTYSENGCTTNELTTAGINTITATVTDSRGRTATSSTSINVLAYELPTITNFTATRNYQDGQEIDWVSVSLSATVKTLYKHNKAHYLIEYKASDVETWTKLIEKDVTSTLPSDPTKYSMEYAGLAFNISIDKSYIFRAIVTDDFGEFTKEIELGTAFVLMDCNSSGKGIAFGKVSEGDNFDVNMPTIFRQGIQTASGADVDTMNTQIAQIMEHLGLT